MAFINARSIGRAGISDFGIETNAPTSDGRLSADGRFLTFFSQATNLVPGFGNQYGLIYLKDFSTGTLVPISISNAGAQPDSQTSGPSISSDGRFVTFTTNASTMVPGGDLQAHIYMRDTLSGSTTRVSEAAGVAGNGGSTNAQISGDGRYVVFETTATNLVADSNGERDIVRKDLLTGGFDLISVSTGDGQADSQSSGARISLDNRFVAFNSYATNLVAGDTNDDQDVFLRDTVAHTTTRISVTTAEAQANGSSFVTGISGDGRYVVFESTSTNLVANDTNNASDVFLRDSVAGTTTRLSVGAGNVQGNASSYDGSISADGRYVVFWSQASNLVAGDTNGQGDVFLRDVAAGTTMRVSVGLAGEQALGGDSFQPRISSDGTYISFYSGATNLVSGDTNGLAEVFRLSLRASETADWMIGSDGNDSVSTLGGDDVIDGKGGADTMTGGLGSDTYIVDNVGDVVIEANVTGVDLVKSSVTFSLAGQYVENLTLTGTAAINATGNSLANTITGNSAANTINGGTGADKMTGGLGNDTYTVDNAGDSVIEANVTGVDTVNSSVTFSLVGQYVEKLTLTGAAAINGTGNSLANTIVGNSAGNIIAGGTGLDTLTGKSGNDVFLFNTALGPTNVDTITDYNVAADTFQLARTIFTGFAGYGQASAGRFWSNTTGLAHDTDDRIIYDTDSGKLFYDADGTGATAGVHFATVDIGLGLTNADFVIV